MREVSFPRGNGARHRRSIPSGRELIIALVLTACATPRPPPSSPPVTAIPSPPPLRARVALSVDDPSDLQARLKTHLRRELSARGIEARVGAGTSEALVVRVVVIMRQRREGLMQLHEAGTRPASGFRLVGGSDDPVRTPEQHDGALEPFDFGKRYKQSDLRMSVYASVARGGGAATLASWDDDEGALVERGDGAEPRGNPWEAVYEAVAARLADRIVATLARAR
jgi:hypothetical protein